MTQDQLFLDGVDTAPRMFCGFPALGLETGKCRSSKCTRRGHNTLDGYCPSCAANRGCNAMKDQGLPLIQLQSDNTKTR